jgi:serine/threonine-protein kinase
MLTGHPPFEAESDWVLVVAHLQQPAPDPRERVPDLPAAIAAVIGQALAKDPAARPATAGALAAACG